MRLNLIDSQKEVLALEAKESTRTRVGFSGVEKRYEWKDHVVSMDILLAMAMWVNRGIGIKGLYIDDLYFWSYYGEQSFLQYVFPVGSARFRFLYYLAAWPGMVAVEDHVGWFVPFNILLNVTVSWSIYFVSRRLSRAKGIGLFCGLMFLISHMAYYQTGRVLGLMETMALQMAIMILWYLFRYLNEKDSQIYFYLSCVLYFGIYFVHERYMALFPLFLLVLLFRKSRKLLEWRAGLSSFLLVQVIRIFIIGGILPAGTGETQVADTFSLGSTFWYAPSQTAYVLGVDAEPEHLDGCPWGQSPLVIKVLVLLADAAIVIIVLTFVVKLAREGRKDYRVQMLENSTLFILFIGLCTASSSVTIRVGTRWMYVSLASTLLFLTYIYGELTEGMKPELYLKRLQPWGTASVCYVVLVLPVELFYRADYPKLCLWPNQLQYSSLAEETYGRYDGRIFSRIIYIIDNSYKVNDFTTRTFFEVFDRDRTAKGTRVEFIKSIRNIGLVGDRMLVPRENPDHEGFQDITEIVRKMRLQMDYGYYSDGWMDEDAGLTVMAGETGVINLEVVYPGIMSSGKAARITRGKDGPYYPPVRPNVVNTTIRVEPWQVVHLIFGCNFYMQNAQEQRGEDRLAAIVRLTVR